MAQQINKFQEISSKTIKVGIALIFFMVAIGALGYMLIEKMTFIEAVFMTIITISTVGFKEVKPLSEPGMVFTIALIISSLGTLAYVGSTLARFVFRRGIIKLY